MSPASRYFPRADIQDGRAFGLAGAYERIIGRVYFAVNPENIHNRPIVDLDKAPRNAQGEVEFSADLYLFKPKDMAKGNNAVLFESLEPRRKRNSASGERRKYFRPKQRIRRRISAARRLHDCLARLAV